MNKFALLNVPGIKGRIQFSMLEINGTCQFSEFCAQIDAEGNLRKQLITAFARMNEMANLKMLPKEKCRDITPKKEKIKEYEIKTSDLRIYLIKEEAHIIILGGKKSTQDEDITKFRSLKQRYLQSKQS